jgi:alpha-ribazole phosphatase
MAVLPPIDLWLVRHARPLIEPGICYGRLDMPADTNHTHESAARLAQALAGTLPLVWCSPMRRARQLADALVAALPGLTYQVDEALAEMDFGAWEGQPWDGIGQTAMDQWTSQFLHHAPGGGETVAQLLNRVRQSLEACHRHAQQNGHPPVLWVTHAGVIRALDVILQHPDPNQLTAADWPKHGPGFGEWVKQRHGAPLSPPAPRR